MNAKRGKEQFGPQRQDEPEVSRDARLACGGALGPNQR